MKRHISNAELTLDALPEPGADWGSVGDFALTFDGYTEHGSFEACAEIANAKRHDSLSDLRTCLFFEQRRWRHFGEIPDAESMSYIHGLVEQIRSRLAAGNIT